jgi:hypothetical protein
MIDRIVYKLYCNLQSFVTVACWGYVCVLLALFLVDIKLDAYLFVILFFLLGLWIGCSVSSWLKSEVESRDLEE